ncbi:putative ABC transporter ATP-binding protein [Corynebacterium occultum]|uniref:Putative ABC transporter ATP-binding protein n=1 Tax=Corynebacterium occultum TaxID=2675219 RepID=A0A6B8VXJ8_9CORY|nr:ABC-F family ATP-binding cassette domain-containing protein [Corynebacterium occultum]QGU07789.1 putative ABC transporter ATP-binding protein [Corynebacterium occultum]
MSVSSSHHLKLDGISFSYPDRRVLTDINFSVPAGRVIGLIGENGAGKSTLLHLIDGTLTPDGGVITTPPTTGFIAQETELPFDSPASGLIEQAVAELRAIETRIEELAARLEEPGAADEFDAALARAEESGLWELDSRISTILAGLGLAEVDPATELGAMSGGQRRRFALAALLLRPVDALVLDEPTNHLDDAAVDFLIAELRSYRGPVLVASHDRHFLDQVADGLVDLDPALGPEGGAGDPLRQGSVYGGAFSEYLAAREDARRRWADDYAAQEQERERLGSKAGQGESDIFHSSAPKSESRISQKFYADRAAKTLGNRLRSARNRLADLERNQIPAPPERLRFHGIPPHQNLAALGVPMVVAGELTLEGRLSPLDLKLQPGEHLLIEGPNGTGKSTFLSLLEGRLEPTSGELLIPEEVQISRLAQDDQWPDLSLTPAEIFTAAQDAAQAAAQNTQKAGAAAQSPDLVGMGLLDEESVHRPIGALSLGQRRRVSLGIILASPPDLLLLDEPTNHLSLALAEELEQALLEFPGTLILATHDRWIRRRWEKHERGRILTLQSV